MIYHRRSRNHYSYKFPVTGAASTDHGRSGVDGMPLPTFPETGADSPVHAYFEDDRISLPKSAVTGDDYSHRVFFGPAWMPAQRYFTADASYHEFGYSPTDEIFAPSFHVFHEHGDPRVETARRLFIRFLFSV